MSDSNPTRARYAANKAAFDSVIGDPFAFPEPINGSYYSLRCTSKLGVSSINGEGKATPNGAAPNAYDYFTDVEHAVQEVIPNKYVRDMFWKTYIEGEEELSKEERIEIEQKVGQRLRDKGIYPPRGYFTATRKGRGNK